MNSIKVGQRVNHKTYGNGVVDYCMNDNATCYVNLGSAGYKRLRNDELTLIDGVSIDASGDNDYEPAIKPEVWNTDKINTDIAMDVLREMCR